MFRSKSESFPFTWSKPPHPHQLESTAVIPQVSINAEAVILSITEDYKFLIFLISYTVAQLKYKHTLPPGCKSPSTRHSAHRQKGQDEFCKRVVCPGQENWFIRLQKKKEKKKANPGSHQGSHWQQTSLSLLIWLKTREWPVFISITKFYVQNPIFCGNEFFAASANDYLVLVTCSYSFF